MLFKKTDSLINIVLPLLIGYISYQSSFRNLHLIVFNNHLADFVWAYAFQSCILIIWERKINTPWTISTVACGLAYELLQYFQVFPGTADVVDFCTYLLAISLSIFLNPYFFKKYKSIPS